jgi:RNA polymerase sigma-70 factor (ECF subfamily)
MGDERVRVDAETVIIGAAQGGNELAWRQLFAWHFDAVYRFCLALTAGRRELAEETTQQVFVTAARQIGRYDPRRGEFRSWLIGIARNRFLVLQAKERRRRRYEALSGQEGSETGEGREADLHVHEALARLPADYRRALECKYLKRLTMKEMAAAKGISIEAIESLLRRARDRFAQVYKQVQNSA